MSGVEAIAAIQLFDACISITETIIDIGRAVKDAQGLPPKLRDLCEKMPAIEDILESARENCKEGNVSEAASDNARPILQQCEQALGELQDIFRKACPKDRDDRYKRVWKGVKTVFLGRDSQVQRLLVLVQDNLRLLEQKEIYVIGDKLDELQHLTEALAQDDGGKYAHTGAGNIIANEGGDPTNYVMSGSGRQINNPGVYHEGSSSHMHTYLPQERPETPPEPSSNVPYHQDPQFIERTALTDQIHTKLSAPAGRAALIGFGGVGKTQLAVEYARQLRQQSPQTWVLWFHASNPTRFHQSLLDVANQLKTYGEKEADLLLRIQKWLRHQSKGKWLVVLDNADDASFLLEPPLALSEAQPTRRRIDYFIDAEHGSMMITTRNKGEALKLVHESKTIEVRAMSEDEAEALLEGKLGQASTENRGLAVALDCMPLAITQAAAHIVEMGSMCSVKEYHEKMERSRTSRTSLLRREVTLPDRDREASSSVLLTWQISFERILGLRKSAADLLSLMSFCDRFAIPETLLREDVEDGEPFDSSSDFEDDIATLRSFLFISDTASPRTWEMHRLVQDATQDWLRDNGSFVKPFHLFVHRLRTSFPTGAFDNWPVCNTLFPHARNAADHKPRDQEVLLEWASVMYNSAWYAREQGNFTDALAMATASMEVRIERLRGDNELTLWSKAMVASIYRNQGRWKEAEELEVKVMETRRTVLRADHPDTLMSMANLSLTYWRQGRWKEAEELEVKVMETSRTVLRADHPSTLTSMANLASIYWSQGRWKEAEELQVKVIEIRRTVLRADHPSTLTSMASLASTYWNQGRWKEAEELDVKVMEIRRTVLGADHPDTLMSIDNLASTYWRQGRWKEAEELDVKVIETRRTMLGADHPDTLNSLNNLAVTYLGQGRLEEAEALQTEAVVGCKKMFGLQHHHTSLVISTLAHIQRMRGQ